MQRWIVPKQKGQVTIDKSAANTAENGNPYHISPPSKWMFKKSRDMVEFALHTKNMVNACFLNDYEIIKMAMINDRARERGKL
jgi:hypothetical protein